MQLRLLGVSVPFGATTVGVNWGKRDAASFTQVAAQYDLSKRTNVNLSLGNDTQSGTSGTNDQYRLSLNHSF
jgi:Gram-negative porin